MIAIPDLINGAYEGLGALFIWQSVKKLHREKMVRGVSWLHVAFFGSWGYWNLFYYPHLGQWLSFVGGLGITVMNTIWFVQMVHYIRKESA